MDEEVKNGEGARSGKRRLITLAVMLLLLVLSSASVFVFLRNVEIKRSWAGEPQTAAQSGDQSADDYNPPLEVKAQIPSPDMLPQRRSLITDELGALLEGTTSRVEETGDGAVRWIHDRATPSAITTATFCVYLGSKDDAVWGRFAAGYVSEAPVYANRLTVDADGTLYTAGIRRNDLGHRDLRYIEKTNEFIDFPADEFAFMLRHVGNGKNVFVCFQNGEREHRFRLTQAQIDAVARMMRILRIREELDEDRRAQAQR